MWGKYCQSKEENCRETVRCTTWREIQQDDKSGGEEILKTAGLQRQDGVLVKECFTRTSVGLKHCSDVCFMRSEKENSFHYSKEKDLFGHLRLNATTHTVNIKDITMKQNGWASHWPYPGYPGHYIRVMLNNLNQMISK